MRKKLCSKLVLKRESILGLNSPALREAAGGGLSLNNCPTHLVSCVTCIGTCTC